jgi:hypothetical protein
VRLEEQLLMNKRFISEVLTVKKEFGKSHSNLIFIFPFLSSVLLTLNLELPNIGGLIEKVNNAGTLLTQYNTLRSR